MLKISIKYIVFVLFIAIIISLLKPAKKTNDPNNVLDIQKINQKNSHIMAASCDLIGNSAEFYWFYEKPNKVYFATKFLKKEQAIVSADGKTYWFWIKSFDPKSVYYCDLDKIELTRVKSPLKPDLIKSLIFIDEIPKTAKVNNNEICFKDGFYSRIIKIEKEKIKEQHWLENNKPTLSAYYNEESIKIVWHEENTKISVFIKNLKINPTHRPAQQMPNLKTINLEDY